MRRSVAGLSVALVLALAATLAAATPRGPALGYPNGRHVAAGRIRLVVNDAAALTPDVAGYVFVTINPRRRLDSHHHLRVCKTGAAGCDFVKLKQWKRHHAKWTYVGSSKDKGYWATTPGEYYWQAYHIGAAGHEVVSRIGSFVVK
jgi:hypothetical protein